MRCRINKQRRIFLGVAALALTLIGFSFFHIHHDTSAKEVSEDSYGDPIDVTITDRVTFSVTSDSNDANVSDITVTNNSSNFALDISNIKATAATGYTLNTYNTDYSSFAVDSKHLGLAYTDNNTDHDLSASGGYNTDISVDTNSPEELFCTANLSTMLTVLRVLLSGLVLCLIGFLTPHQRNGSTYTPRSQHLKEPTSRYILIFLCNHKAQSSKFNVQSFLCTSCPSTYIAENGRDGHTYSQAPHPMQAASLMAGIIGDSSSFSSIGTISMAPEGQ